MSVRRCTIRWKFTSMIMIILKNEELNYSITLPVLLILKDHIESFVALITL